MSTRGDPAILQESAPRGLDDAPAASEPLHREPDGAPEAQRRQSFLLDLNDQMRAIDDPLAIMARATAMLGACLGASRVGYGEVDAREETITVERDWTGGTLPNAVGSYRLELFGTTVLELLRYGKTLAIGDVATDSRLVPSARAVYDSVGTQALVVVPLVKNGGFRAMLFAHQCQPRSWTADDIALVEDVAERTWSAVERARVEAALRKSEERLRLSQEAGGVGLWDWDLKTGELFWSDKQYDLLGIPRGTPMTVQAFVGLIHPEDRQVAESVAEGAQRGERTLESEFRILRPGDGRTIWLASRGEVSRDAEGSPTRIVGVNFDITDRRNAEAKLRESAERLQLALRASRMGDWNWDAQTDLIMVSPRAGEIFQIDPGEPFSWRQLQGLIHPDDAAMVIAAVDQAFASGEQYEVEYRYARVPGRPYTWIASKGQPFYWPDGRLKGMTGVVQDITERKRAEERQQLLIRELHHRVKNTLATVQAIVGSTARNASSIEEFYEGFVGRIVSLAQTHNLLTEDYWQKASLAELLKNELGPYEDGTRSRIALAGPAVELPSEAAVPVGMAIHELTTNAVKHGSLSRPDGTIAVAWEVRQDGERPMLHFTWTERGGPKVRTPTRQGFGSRLLQRVLTAQLQADVNMDFAPDGIRFIMNMPLPRNAPLFNILS